MMEKDQQINNVDSTASNSKPTTKVSSDMPPVRPYVLRGIFIIVFFIGGFLFWAITSTLESASVAVGQIVSESMNKTIEHLEGGVVKEIYVKEGQKVKRDQTLITLDTAKSKANYDIFHEQYQHLLAEKLRLVAERDNTEIIWPKELENTKQLKQVQERLLKANRRSIDSQSKILNKQIAQLKDEIKSYQAQIRSEFEQLKLINQEAEVVADLERRKLIELPKLLALKREAARLLGNQEEHIGFVARAKQKIGEIEHRLVGLNDNYLQQTIAELKEVNRKLAEVRPKMEAAIDTLNRSTIKAPISGTVFGLTQFTIGGVITPGEPLMQIVPSQDRLIAEVMVQASDIEVVHVGQVARVQLLAFKQRNTPMLIGKVIHLSADAVKTKETEIVHYNAKISIPDKELKKLDLKSLQPGMQVQAMILTSKRSPMDYFITPIVDSFRYAFREH